MPAVTGSIRFEDYTLFLIAAMVELRTQPPGPPPGHPLAALLGQMPQSDTPAIGIMTDMNIDGAERLVEIVADNMDDFLGHLEEIMQAAQPVVGINVWQGTLEVSPDGEVSFEGEFRRPSTVDFGTLASIHTALDDEARKHALAHAKHCHACAEKMGLDPSEVTEAPSEKEIQHIRLRIPAIPGEH
jgi:hypothetical protein